MNCRWWIVVAVASLMVATGCSDDTGTDKGDENQWDLNGDAGADTDGDEDVWTAEDAGVDEDVDTAEDAGTGEDADEPGEDTGVEEDTGFEEDTDPPPADELTPDMLIGEPWYGVWRITDDPAITGSFIGVEFVDEDNVVLHGEEENSGNWEILGSGEVYLYDLEGDIEQFMMEPDMGEEGLAALEVFTPVQHVDPYTARYERLGEADVDFAELGARWQTTERLTTEEGDEVHLALRIDADGIVEYGIVAGEEDLFIPFLEGPGFTHTYDTGHTFWGILVDTDDEGAPFGGEIREEGDGLILYAFSEDHDDEGPGGGPPGGGGGPELVVVELESVSQFGD